MIKAYIERLNYYDDDRTPRAKFITSGLFMIGAVSFGLCAFYAKPAVSKWLAGGASAAFSFVALSKSTRAAYQAGYRAQPPVFRIR